MFKKSGSWRRSSNSLSSIFANRSISTPRVAAAFVRRKNNQENFLWKNSTISHFTFLPKRRSYNSFNCFSDFFEIGGKSWRRKTSFFSIYGEQETLKLVQMIEFFFNVQDNSEKFREEVMLTKSIFINISWTEHDWSNLCYLFSFGFKTSLVWRHQDSTENSTQTIVHSRRKITLLLSIDCSSSGYGTSDCKS